MHKTISNSKAYIIPKHKTQPAIHMDIGVVIGTVIALVVLVIGIVIVNDVIDGAGFGGTLDTVTQNIPILLGVGGLVLAVGWIAMR